MGLKLKIDLKKLTLKGLVLSYQHTFTPLTQKLQPLIGKNDYTAKIRIQKTSPSTFIISGQIQTHLNLLCARCAYEFQKPLLKNFEEKILLKNTSSQINKPTQIKKMAEPINQDNCILLNQDILDLGDLLYDLIAVEEPLRPLNLKACDDENSSCEHLERIKDEIKQNDKVQVHFS